MPAQYEPQKEIEKINEAAYQILSSAQALCSQSGAKLVVVFNAHEQGDREKWQRFCEQKIGESFDFNQICMHACKSYGIAFIDLRQRSPRQYYFLQEDAHYSPAGNRWAAAEVSEYLKQEIIP